MSRHRDSNEKDERKIRKLQENPRKVELKTGHNETNQNPKTGKSKREV